MSEEVYIVAQIAIKEYDAYFTQYGAPFIGMIKKFKGRVIAANKEAETLEGPSFGNWTVLLKFPSRALALNFMNSKEYAPLKDLRINELTTDNRIFLLPAKIGV